MFGLTIRRLATDHGVLEAQLWSRHLESRSADHRFEITGWEKHGVHAEQVFASGQQAATERGRIEFDHAKDAAGSEDTRRLGQDSLGSSHVVERIEDDHSIDGLVDQWEAGRVTSQASESVAPGAGHHAGGGVDYESFGEIECPNGLPGATAYVEDALDRTVGAGEDSVEALGIDSRAESVVEGGESVEDRDVAGSLTLVSVGASHLLGQRGTQS